jgi:hypothetical protein
MLLPRLTKRIAAESSKIKRMLLVGERRTLFVLCFNIIGIINSVLVGPNGLRCRVGRVEIRGTLE